MYQEDFLQTDQIYFYHNISDTPSDGFISHCHAVYEVFYFIEGDIDYRVESSEYLLTPGSILLIPPNTFHGVKINSCQKYHRFSIHFLPELFVPDERSLLLSIFKSRKWYFPVVEKYHLDPYFSAILDCIHLQEPLKSIALKARITSLLSQLLTIYDVAKPFEPCGNRTAQKLAVYINEHLGEKITLDLLSERFFLSKNHMNVVFKKATGTTILQYIRLKRLALAQNEMLRGAAAGEAALKSGFTDYSNFYRAYKMVYGCEPSRREFAQSVKN